jgi:hypothetical protein
MKKLLKPVLTTVACLFVAPAFAQMGGPHGGMMGHSPSPQFAGAMEKLFGDNKAFSATMVMDSGAGGMGQAQGKMSYDNGKSRFEMNLAESKSMPPQQVEQMKSMGMDRMVMISRPDEKLDYQMFPSMNAYFTRPMHDSEATKPESDFKVEKTELGKETVDGHPCIKNKVVVTNNEGKTHESTVWNATDLNSFPLKIETVQDGKTMTILFKDVKLAKPDAALFAPPSDFKKYESMQAMMMQMMQKQMGGGMGAPGEQ